MVAYSAAKAGIISATKAIAKEVGRYGININCVSAAATKTERQLEKFEENPDREAKMLRFYPLGRLGEPSDLANAITFLASERASWITGQTLSVNGGYSMVS